MRTVLTILAFSLAFVGSAQTTATTPFTAQTTTMRDVLKQMPDTLVPFLKENARLDFIDFIESNMKAEVSNSLEGKSELTKLTDNYAMLWLTQASQMEMRLLDTAEEVDSVRQLLCIVCTYGTDIRESTVEFYSLRWRKLTTDERVGLPTDMFIAALGVDEPTLSICPELRLDAPANEEQEELSKPSIILKWNGEMFKEY